MSNPQQRTVLIRVGWMLYYGFRHEESGPVGGGAFNKDDRGSEIENFRVVGGQCRGYAQVSRKAGGFNLKRIAPFNIGDSATDVLVVSVATDPEHGGQVVVGWHGKTICFRNSRERGHGEYGLTNFTASAENCVLLPVLNRTWDVPKGKGGMGQANVCYALDVSGQPHRGEWLWDIVDRINRYKGASLLTSNAPARGSARPVALPPRPPPVHVGVSGNGGDALTNPTADPEELERRVTQLMAIPFRKPAGEPRPRRVQGASRTTYERRPDVKAWVLRQARGRCERCQCMAPFKRTDGTPYLELHHAKQLAEGGPDTVDNAVALCPNCHRLLHNGLDRTEQLEQLYMQLARLVRCVTQEGGDD